MSYPHSWDISVYLTNIPVFFPFLSNNEKREELEHGLQAEIPKLEEWKSHIIRSVHQDAAKTAAVDALSETDALLIMDWAMKFLPTSYRETQRDWYGKKGKPWHITVAITKADNEEIEVRLMLQWCLSYYSLLKKIQNPMQNLLYFLRLLIFSRQTYRWEKKISDDYKMQIILLDL